ncbi:lytic polysaccharide monooxygenase [Hazenella sp. IB182353]|uniref:lytic polysaccharide monooxygenase n=1 Tax=Polycladospora coralii TaxID=2771432 RepID=UPI001745DA71|nr:lytic polysaccharide monooxygenase [Polycladospora coralii]MBS7531209.1 lytic polysaccharide monooxygenase [Polycladospora coralii]
MHFLKFRGISTIKGMFFALFVSLCWWIQADDVLAHGYIESPASRSYTGSLMKDQLGYQQALDLYGSAIKCPQCVEGPKGFPQGGPADGEIASAGGGFGQIDRKLDLQTADRWSKQNISTGMHTFRWKYTAPHKTSKWHYYITKDGWNPNEPLKKSDLELMATVDHDGSAASNNLSHQIEIPKGKSGYHIILGVWDVADTSNAFYQVIDANISDQGTPDRTDTEAPTTPTGVKTTKTESGQISLQWTAAKDNVGIQAYEIYRDGKKVGSSSAPTFTDKGLKANTSYTYTIKAVDQAGNASQASEALTVSTQKETTARDVEAPTGLHTMKVTSDSVNLMWTAATGDIKAYSVYRDNQKIATTTDAQYTDTGLQADQTYTYYVKAVSTSGEQSANSNEISVKTVAKSENTPSAWQAGQVYVKGDQVLYQGNRYEALWWTKDVKPSTLEGWKILDDGAVLTWSKDSAYQGGSIVLHQGDRYRAKWWTRGDVPGQHAVWEKVE